MTKCTSKPQPRPTPANCTYSSSRHLHLSYVFIVTTFRPRFRNRFIIELCAMTHLKHIEIGNLEMFSAQIQSFVVSIAPR